MITCAQMAELSASPVHTKLAAICTTQYLYAPTLHTEVCEADHERRAPEALPVGVTITGTAAEETRMSTVLSLVGAIGIIGSLLFSGWQARVLAKQVSFQSTMNGVATLHSVMAGLHNVQRFLADDPSLIPHFAPERSDSTLETADPAKVKMVAGMYADVLNVGLYALSAVPAATGENAWEVYCKDLLANSPALRAEVARRPWGYPRLMRFAAPLGPKDFPNG